MAVNKSVLGFAAAFLLFLAVAASMVGYSLWKSGSLERGSKAWVSNSLPSLLSDWSLPSLEAVAANKFAERLAQQPAEVNQRLAAWSQRLGDWQKNGAISGQTDVIFPYRGSHKDPIFIADYRLTVTFTKGSAEVTLGLVKQQDTWVLRSLSIDSQPLLPVPAP